MEDEHMLDLDQEEGGVPTLNLDANSDLCEELMKRYGKSGAIQHRHLCASASAMRIVLKEEGLPLTPLSYFAATISAIDDTVSSFSSSSENSSSSFDSKATSSLTSFLSILLPLIPYESLPSSKANDAVTVLVSLLKIPKVAQSPATIRSVIKSLGFLIKLCDFEAWNFGKSIFEMILEFSIDKRPKVRKCAQVCVEEIYKSVQCTNVVNEASDLFYSTMFYKYLPFAIAIAWSKVEITKDSELAEELKLMESVHMLSVLKIIVLYLSNDVVSKVMSQFHKVMGCKYSLLTRHNFAFLEVILEFSKVEEIVVPKTEIIIFGLGNYVSPKESNPADTILAACVLLKKCIDKLYAADKRNIWVINLPLVFEPIAGVVGAGLSVSGDAVGILKEVVNQHIDDGLKTSASNGTLASDDDKLKGTPESKALQSICDAVFMMRLTNSDGELNENILAVISNVFVKLGELSYFYLKDVVHKLAELLRVANGDTTRSKYQHLEECFGSAVIAMGPEKILTLLPVSFDEEELTSLNIWILPILKKYVIGSSLEYYMDHIIPLVEPLKQACKTVTKSRVRKKLQAAIRAFWDLLPAFCRYPTDTHKKFKALSKLLLRFIKEEESMHENVCLALQQLVNQNRSIVKSTQGLEDSSEQPTTSTINESIAESRNVPAHYTKKVAKKNIKALASRSVDLLQALTDVFLDSPLEKRKYLKEAIGCLASITEIIEVKKIFISLLEKIQSKSGTEISGELENQGGNMKVDEQEAQRCVIMEFASALLIGASEDLVDIIFDYITPALQDEGIVLYSAYCTLSKIFEEHSWFYSSRFDEMLSHLLGLKLPDDIMGLRSRFACLHTLFVYLLKSNSEETHAKAFLILNEIILALKDSKEDARKAAYDVLLKISCSLKSLSSPNLESPHAKLLNMIAGYLSGASPSIMSGAVAALSLLIYNESDICASAPEVVPSVLALLKSKAKEVIKTVLGFVKVLVSTLQASDLQNLLPDIVQGILPWSSVSRSHFREKVTVILEILIRKCGATSVEIDVPEKYMKYFKTVKEQRRGKNSSDKDENVDKVDNPDSSTAGRHKRVHRELSNTSQNETPAKKHKFDTPNRNNSHKASGKGSQFFQKSDRAQSHSQKGRRPASTSKANQHKKGSFRGRQSAK
ncbi:RRP12-like protein [Papaver somniferum]|uniref:RRP12-like protein n=1 Tax=Papaver somniferum TaxID=3469 RepID=UPI000E6F6227|nr:RRP12-like protein [Papaver somniferum]